MAMVKDMTKGRETPLLISFMLPMLVGNIFQQLYNIADSAIVGRFEGSTSLGAIGSTGSLTWMLFSMSFGLSVGAGILISQNFGAGNKMLVKNTIANSFYLVSTVGLTLSVLGFVLAEPLLKFMDTPKVQLDEAVTYMRIISVGTFGVSLYNFASQAMRALGDSTTPLIFLIVSSFINIGLDLYFIVDLGWGVAGAAWATVISQYASAILCLVYAFLKNKYFRLSRKNLQFDANIILKCCRIGIPLGAQNGMIAVSCVILQRVVNGFDALAVSAYTVTLRVEQLVQQPYSSLGAAISYFAGQNIGAGKTERVQTAMKKSVILVAGFSAVMLAVMVFFGKNIVNIFVSEKDVIAIGANGLRITGIMFFPLGMIYITRGILNGAGDAAYAMINGIVEVAGRVGFSLILVKLLGFGLYSVWLTTGLTWLITGITGTIRYYQGKWRKFSMVDR